MYEIRVEAGEDTEALLRYITTEVDVDVLDSVEVERDYVAEPKLVAEPISTAAAITTVSVTAIVAVARLIERWLENKRQEANLGILLNAATKDTEAGAILGAAVEKHADVALSYKLPNRATFQE